MEVVAAVVVEAAVAATLAAECRAAASLVAEWHPAASHAVEWARAARAWSGAGTVTVPAILTVLAIGTAAT